jgi:ATP-binding cassette subfamily B protein
MSAPPPVVGQPLHKHADRLLARTAAVGLVWTGLLVATTALGVALVLARPAALATAVDATVHGAPDHRTTLLWLTVLSVGIVVATVVAQLTEAFGVARVTVWLRMRLVSHTLALGLDGQRRFPAGDLASRVSGGASHAAGVTPLVVDAVAGVVMSVGAAVALWLIDWHIVLMLAVAGPVGAVIVGALVRDTASLTSRYQRAQGDLAARFVDAARGARTIRASHTEAREIERITVPLPEVAAAGHALWRTYGISAGRAGLLVPLVSLAALGVAGQGVAAGRVTPGELLATAAYIPMALGLLDHMTMMSGIAVNRVSARRLAEVLVVPAPTVGAAALPPGPGTLVLTNVSVRAGDTPQLDGVNLTVPGGRTMAVVGRSGAGKSTLARVAGRLVDPDSGCVQLDGVHVDELEPRALRAAVAYAFEQPSLLGATVADAIGYGATRINRSRIEKAVDIAQARAFVDRLPDELDTPLAGTALSGGERQRLGLARAIARGGRLLILDDATSNLDTLTEAQLRDALAAAAPDRTRLVIAHRASTAAHADLVVWLDAGRVRRVGTHADLWDDAGYRAVFHDEVAPAVAAVSEVAPVVAAAS